MAIDRTRYRQLDFIGARILQARELNWLQEIEQGVAVSDNETSVSGELQSIYRQGATKNITIGISGLVVTLSATDGAKPMEIFVRDRWEIYPGANDDTTDTIGTNPANHTLTLSSLNTDVFLNWELKIRTGGLTGDDPSLTDSITNEAVASAGELILHLSNVDTSAAALTGSQLAKNVSPVSLFKFTNSGTVLTLVPQDNVVASARANSKTSGLVKTSTDTATVVSTDDAVTTNARPASDGSVHDASVRVPVAFGGTNVDGSNIYKLPGDGGSDIGGISAAKIILINFTQTLEDGWNLLKTAFNSLLSRYNSHETAALGSVNTHPVPTAAQVGAAPSSHVGQVLGLATSHPPVVNTDSGGFRVNRSSGGGSVDDPAYGVFVSGNPIVSMNHDGDLFSSAADAFSVILGGGLTASGSLGHLSKVAKILRDHVNQQSHGNPHGLVAGDIGAASTAYVDAAVAGILASAQLYTDSHVPGLSLSVVNISQSTGGSAFNPNIRGKYVIFRFAPNNGNAIEIAFGSGTARCDAGLNVTVPLPNIHFTTTNSLCTWGLRAAPDFPLDPYLINSITSTQTPDPNGMVLQAADVRYNGSGDPRGSTAVIMSWNVLAWRQGA
jgi:hypothetical protein